jgi:deoxyadenosine/deoxycytidine kinase
MTKHLVLVAGNIGAGKTSLTERIGQQLGWLTAYESVADNPYLPDFYRDMATWSMHLQMYFLGHRARQHEQMATAPLSAILDRSIYEDAAIFARALHQMGNLNERDYQTYRTLFQLVTEKLPRPNLLIYLKAPPTVLFHRIQQRGRSMENSISLDYLNLLDRYYTEWLQSFDLCPVLTIRSDDLDFVHQPEALQIVIQRMQTKLSGKEELVF